MYILCKQNWQCFGSYFWISHAIHLLLLSDFPNSSLSNENSVIINRIQEKLLTPRLFEIKNCYTFSQFSEKLVSEIQSKIVFATGRLKTFEPINNTNILENVASNTKQLNLMEIDVKFEELTSVVDNNGKSGILYNYYFIFHIKINTIVRFFSFEYCKCLL